MVPSAAADFAAGKIDRAELLGKSRANARADSGRGSRRLLRAAGRIIDFVHGRPPQFASVCWTDVGQIGGRLS